jgi:hypothetical protein
LAKRRKLQERPCIELEQLGRLYTTCFECYKERTAAEDKKNMVKLKKGDPILIPVAHADKQSSLAILGGPC